MHDTIDVLSPHDHQRVLGRYSAATSGQVDTADRRRAAGRADWSRTPWWDRAADPAARRRTGQRQVPQRAARHHDARPVEDLPPGRDRRGLRARRLLPVQRPLRRADLLDPAGVAARGVQLPRPPRPRGVRARDHPVQLHRDRRQPAHHPGPDGQHRRVEALGEVRAGHRGGHAGAGGGRHAARRHQQGARLRRGHRRPGHRPRAVRRAELHRIDRGVPRPVGEDRQQRRHLPQLPADRR